jgi:aminoglycoside phosphotransferase (APT) family kinase protein
VKMHADEVVTDESLVRRLLTAQFPEWSALPIERVEPAGTDNAIYRLGNDLAVRLPRIHWAAEHPEKEHEWLPKLAPRLPLPIPVPLALGAPGEGYPWHWSVCPWLDGETVSFDRVADVRELAADLAQFVAALRRIDPVGGPLASRGVPLAPLADEIRETIVSLQGELDADAVTAVWNTALDAPSWDGPPMWTHGDLDPRNLLVTQGRLSAVIDLSGLGVGDPACDIGAAWKVLPAGARDVFRAALSVDNATWARSRGWVVQQAVMILSYYTLDTNAVLVLEARRWLEEVLA